MAKKAKRPKQAKLAEQLKLEGLPRHLGKRRGRPPKEVHEHTPQRSFRISDEDYAAIQAAAAAEGMDTTAWVRKTLLSAAHRTTK